MKLIQMQTIITAIGFCPKCEKEKQAAKGKNFVMHENGVWHDMVTTQKSHIWGLVPHIYKLERSLEDGNVSVLSSCAIEGCGSYWKKMKDASYIVTKNLNYGTWHLSIKDKDYQRIILKAKDWNNLVLNPYNLDFEADFVD